MKKLILISVMCVLALAAWINLRPQTVINTYGPQHPLTTLTPDVPKGWTAENTPISATEGGAEWALNTLNLTSYFYKTYRHGDLAVRVYVAYWSAGKMDPRLVWAHQPDVCWLSNGASIISRDNTRRLPDGGERRSLPALFRVFQFPNGREEVVFWHLVGRHLSGFQSDSSEVIVSKWEHFARSLRLSEFGLAPQEQLVVRISTNHTIDEALSSELWPSLSAMLQKSGIFEQNG